MDAKAVLLVLCSVFLFACEEEPVIPPPENLIAEDVFIDLMTELQLYDALVYTTDAPQRTDSLVNVIFDKYETSPDQYLSSQIYYQSQIEAHMVRLDTVLARLEREHQSLDGTFGSGLTAE
jgi:hypothetical protein